MISGIFSSNKSNAIIELLEVIGKGINLLGRENLTKELLDSWKNYLLSTLELVDTAYSTNYAISFFDEDNPYSIWQKNYFSCSPICTASWSTKPFSVKASPNFQWDSTTANEYKDTIQRTLQKLIIIAQRISKE